MILILATVFKDEYCKTDWLRVTLCDYLEKKSEIQ